MQVAEDADQVVDAIFDFYERADSCKRPPSTSNCFIYDHAGVDGRARPGQQSGGRHVQYAHGRTRSLHEFRGAGTPAIRALAARCLWACSAAAAMLLAAPGRCADDFPPPITTQPDPPAAPSSALRATESKPAATVTPAAPAQPEPAGAAADAAPVEPRPDGTCGSSRAYRAARFRGDRDPGGVYVSLLDDSSGRSGSGNDAAESTSGVVGTALFAVRLLTPPLPVDHAMAVFTRADAR